MLVDIFGTAKRFEDWVFVPAALALCEEAKWTNPVQLVGLDGVLMEPEDPDEEGELPAPLQEVRDRLAADVSATQFLWLWARARVPVIFDVSPMIESDGCGSALFELCFVAVNLEWPTDLRAVPLLCSSELGDCPELCFDGTIPYTQRREIAEAFWSLLLADPFGLQPFWASYEDKEEAGIGQIGLDHHGFYHEFSAIWDDSEERRNLRDSHLAVKTGEIWLCPECGGSGEESFIPAGATCEICSGSGVVSWCLAEDPHDNRKRRHPRTPRDG